MKDVLTPTEKLRVEHFKGQIGKEDFNILMRPENMSAIKSLVKEIKGKHDAERLKIGDRVYRLIRATNGKAFISGPELIKRAKTLQASLGGEEGEFIMKHKEDIPLDILDGRLILFTDWRLAGYNNHMYVINCRVSGPVRDWRHINTRWGIGDYIIQRER